jgi:hypothetical protein
MEVVENVLDLSVSKLHRYAARIRFHAHSGQSPGCGNRATKLRLFVTRDFQPAIGSQAAHTRRGAEDCCEHMAKLPELLRQP